MPYRRIQSSRGNRQRRGENGQFAGREYVGSYLQFIVEVPEATNMLLEAHGHNTAIINGQLRGGDTYQRWHQIPVELKAGRNQLLFHAARGRFQGRLLPLSKTVYLAPQDRTIPDILVDKDSPLWAAMPVVNATFEALDDLEIRTSTDSGTVHTTRVGSVLPMTLRKVGFQFIRPADVTGDSVNLTVELAHRGQTDPLDIQQINVPVRGSDQPHVRTYVSNVDGSVQYYAVNPATRQGLGDSEKPGVLLTLHGAGVEGKGQANVYQAKTDLHVVAPTNRRAFGFDWEDWGRTDAIDVLEDFSRREEIDPQRVLLTGHSMGGHGTWHLGATFPDRFAAIGPSAGWVSFWSYAGGQRTENPGPVVALLERAANPSDTLQLASNYASMGVYVLHGDRDNNVPVAQARTMREVLAGFHRDFAYYEQPGAGHWWGNACCDWPPMIEFLGRHERPPNTLLNEIDFTTFCPGISSSFGWATVVTQNRPLLASHVDLKLDRGEMNLTGTTKNVAVLKLDLATAFADSTGEEVLRTKLDGVELDLTVSDQWLEQTDGIWRTIERPPNVRKGPGRYGPFKAAFDHRFLFVYGTAGTDEENAWSLNKARYDAETFWYRGNGSIEVVADRHFSPDQYADRSVILYGNADTNLAWTTLLADCPLQIDRNSVSLGEHSIEIPEVGALFVYPRADSPHALVGVVGGTGIHGLRSTNRLRYFVSGIAYPDIMLVSAEFLNTGKDGLLAAGYWDSHWQLDGAEISWHPSLHGEKKNAEDEQSIFDGHTRRGWHAIPEDSLSDWSVVDGTIVGRGTADRLSYLVWQDDDLTDFELQLEYRLPGQGNSGIEIRCRPDPTGKRPLQGYHADLGHVGIGAHILGAWDFHFGDRNEPACPRGTRLLIGADEKTASSRLARGLTLNDIRKGQWNHVRIVARGNHFEFFINEKLASEFTDESAKGRLDRGSIALQIHDAGMQVEFKNIRLSQLHPLADH